jgi:hypothetical protein
MNQEDKLRKVLGAYEDSRELVRLKEGELKDAERARAKAHAEAERVFRASGHTEIIKGPRRYHLNDEDGCLTWDEFEGVVL